MSEVMHLSPEEREALKQEVFSSLHCAFPGTVVSFDPVTQTAEIQPAVKVGSLLFPVLPDVPVFFPGTREEAITWPVSAGDECLLILADVDIDAWFESGEATVPQSARKHSLSDAFAFVGFRSRPNVLDEFPESKHLFPHDHDDRYYTETETDEKLAGKSDADHVHDTGDITSGTLPVARGGTGNAGTGSTTTIQSIATAAADCEITTAQYAYWGKVAMVRLVVKKTGAVTSGTTTLCTLAAGKRPKYTAPAQWRWNNGGQITTAGAVQVNGAIPANTSITIYATYILA